MDGFISLGIRLLAAISILTMIHLSAMALCAALLGARPRVFKLFVGPSILRRVVRGVRFELGVIPAGGFVNFRDEESEHDSLRAIHPFAQAAVVLSGCAMLVIFGLIAGAPLEMFPRGFVQIVSGLISPKAVGAALIMKLFELLRGDAVYATAALAMKMAAANLFPVPGLNGFQALVALVRGVRLFARG